MNGKHSRSPLSPERPIRAGQKKLTFTQELKRGGFGIIYKGHYKENDHKPEKIVAIKEYLPEECAIRCAGTADVVAVTGKETDFEEGLERFRREAEILDECEHSNIVSFDDIFEAYNTAYIVMEFVDGQELSERLRDKGKLQEAELKDILCPLLDALEVVHQKEFVHRDIKPSNIILRSDDSPVLLDFGSAQPIGRNQKDLVTDYYSPPEQYNTWKEQKPCTDIYALGAVCYQALMGEHLPQTGKERDSQDLGISTFNKVEKSTKFCKAIDKALEAEPENRPQTVKEWKEMMDLSPPESLEKEIADEESPPDSEQEGAAGKEMMEPPSPKHESAETAEEGAPPEPSEKEVADEVPPTKQVPRKSRFKLSTALAALFSFCVIGSSVGVYVVYKDGWTPLHLAAWFGRSEVVRVLLDSKADVDATYDNGWTPLHLAARQGHSEVVRVLLDAGADDNATDDNGRTPLHLAVEHNASETERVLLDHREEEEWKIFKEKTGQEPTPGGIYKRKPHLYVAVEQNLPTVTRLLLDGGENVHAKGGIDRHPDWTPLHLAAWHGHSEVVRVLIEKGADVYATSDNGWTPLHLAARFGRSEVVRVLIEKGADVYATDKDGRTPLHLTAMYNASDVARVLLIDGRADVNAKDNDGKTPLHLAAWWANPALQELLAKRWGADVNAKDNDGKTPLHWTARHDASQDASRAAKELLDRKADVDAKDNNGRTPLHTAAESGSFEVVKVLCFEGGADVDAKDNDGKTPEDMDPSPMVKQLFPSCRYMKEILKKK